MIVNLLVIIILTVILMFRFPPLSILVFNKQEDSIVLHVILPVHRIIYLTNFRNIKRAELFSTKPKPYDPGQHEKILHSKAMKFVLKTGVCDVQLSDFYFAYFIFYFMKKNINKINNFIKSNNQNILKLYLFNFNILTTIIFIFFVVSVISAIYLAFNIIF